MKEGNCGKGRERKGLPDLHRDPVECTRGMSSLKSSRVGTCSGF